ncbi:MAG: signal peptidase I [Nanoarchaeota archaeon]|nr:signal peptidase I [Nanoarchaeota archaeon]
MLKKIAIITILIFIFSILVGNVYSQYSGEYEKPSSIIKAEKISPYDHISQDQIKVYNDKIIITIDNATWARFTDTNSMDPIIDIGANSIEIKPKSINQVHIGDIISYKSNFMDGIIIHRVIDIGEDKEGAYFYTKGDNNLIRDPEKVRFEQIHGIVVGVLY